MSGIHAGASRLANGSRGSPMSPTRPGSSRPPRAYGPGARPLPGRPAYAACLIAQRCLEEAGATTSRCGACARTVDVFGWFHRPCNRPGSS
jgi:hypothetical protein